MVSSQIADIPTRDSWYVVRMTAVLTVSFVTSRF